MNAHLTDKRRFEISGNPSSPIAWGTVPGVWHHHDVIVQEGFSGMVVSGGAESSQTVTTPIANSGRSMPATWKWANHGGRGAMQVFQEEGAIGCLEVWDTHVDNVLLAEFPSPVSLSVGDTIRVEVQMSHENYGVARGTFFALGLVGATDTILSIPLENSVSTSGSTASDSGSGTIRVASTNHAMQNGDLVRVESGTGALGMWEIENVTTNTFDLKNSVWASQTVPLFRRSTRMLTRSGSRLLPLNLTDGTALTGNGDAGILSASRFGGTGRTLGYFTLELEYVSSGPDTFSVRLGSDNSTDKTGFTHNYIFPVRTPGGTPSNVGVSMASLTGITGIPTTPITGVAFRAVTGSHLSIQSLRVTRQSTARSTVSKEPNWGGCCVNMSFDITTTDKTVNFNKDITVGELRVLSAAGTTFASSPAGSRFGFYAPSGMRGLLTNNNTQASVLTFNDVVDLGATGIVCDSFARNIRFNAGLSGTGPLIIRGQASAGVRDILAASPSFSGSVIVLSGGLRPVSGGLGTTGLTRMGGEAMGGLVGPFVSFTGHGQTHTISNPVSWVCTHTAPASSGTYRLALGSQLNGCVLNINSDMTLTTATYSQITARAMATSVPTLSGLNTFDTVSMTDGDVLLVAADSVNSGPWVVRTGAWERPAWYAAGSTAHAYYGLRCRITEGSAHIGKVPHVATTGQLAIGTTTVNWSQTARTRRTEIFANHGSTLNLYGNILVNNASSSGTFGWNTSGFGRGYIRVYSTGSTHTNMSLLVGGWLIFHVDIALSSGTSAVGTVAGISFGDGSTTSSDVFLGFDGARTFNRTIGSNANPRGAHCAIVQTTAHTSSVQGTITTTGRALNSLEFSSVAGGVLNIAGILAGSSDIATLSVRTIAVSAGGTGYTNTDDVTNGSPAVTGGSGTGVEIHTSVASNAVTRVHLIRYGIGYKHNDVLTILGGGGNATATISKSSGTVRLSGSSTHSGFIHIVDGMTVEVNISMTTSTGVRVGGGVAKFTISAGGTGYSTTDLINTTLRPAASATGDGFTFGITASGGAVTAVTVTQQGSGYTVGEVLTVPGGGGDATLTVSSVDDTGGILQGTGTVPSVTVTNHTASVIRGGTGTGSGGTLNVSGNLTMSGSNSRLQVTYGSGTCSRVAVTGTAAMDSCTVDLIDTIPAGTYNIVTSAAMTGSPSIGATGGNTVTSLTVVGGVNLQLVIA